MTVLDSGFRQNERRATEAAPNDHHKAAAKVWDK